MAVGADPNDDPAPIVSEAELYNHIANLLDEARSELAGAAAWPVSVPGGLSDFDAPQSFLMLNRALKARTEVQRNNWSAALQALSESFLDADRALDYGAYHNWSVNSGDMVNPANRPDLLWANTRFRDEAQLRADGSRTCASRTSSKSSPTYQLLEVASDLQYTLYEKPGDPFVWVKNEELVLLRAEANLAMGDRDKAIEDINLVRMASGGLEPLPDPYTGTDAELLERAAVQQAVLSRVRVGPHLDRP